MPFIKLNATSVQETFSAAESLNTKPLAGRMSIRKRMQHIRALTTSAEHRHNKRLICPVDLGQTVKIALASNNHDLTWHAWASLIKNPNRTQTTCSNRVSECSNYTVYDRKLNLMWRGS